MKIYTISNTRADFIELQKSSFDKSLQESYQFTVFNNAAFSQAGSQERNSITATCNRLGITCIDVQKDRDLINRCQLTELSGPILNTSGFYTSVNAAAGYALCWAWDNVISKERDAVCILDSDVFLVHSVKLTDYLQKYNFAWVAQARPGYEFIWPVFFLADLAKMPNPESLDWYCGSINGTPLDVSGQTYHYLKAHPELISLRIQQRYVQEDPEMGIPHADYEMLLLENKEVAVHYRSGSNWNRKSQEYHRIKTNWLKGLLNG
jgi:hypothetical protein